MKTNRCLKCFVIALCVFSLLSDVDASSENDFRYCEQEAVEHVGIIEGKFYKNAVKQLPICCVDVFLYHPIKRAYLLVLRNNPPAKGEWWFPGGRMFKGESFYACAVRKCREEASLNILPIAQLGAYSTIFPDSAWDCQTHTVNIAVLGVLQASNSPVIDQDHQSYEWIGIDVVPQDPCLSKIYQEAIKIISKITSDALGCELLRSELSSGTQQVLTLLTW